MSYVNQLCELLNQEAWAKFYYAYDEKKNNVVFYISVKHVNNCPAKMVVFKSFTDIDELRRWAASLLTEERKKCQDKEKIKAIKDIEASMLSADIQRKYLFEKLKLACKQSGSPFLASMHIKED